MRFGRFAGDRTGFVVEQGRLRALDVVADAAALRVQEPAAGLIAEVLLGDPAQSWVQMTGRWDEVRSAFVAFGRAAPDPLPTSKGVALKPGTDGPHWLKPGDVIEALPHGVAPLRNTVAA